LLIEVKVGKLEGNEYVLIVRDNGIGVPKNFDPHSTDSLG
jgi:two-component sensor histidine kinase